MHNLVTLLGLAVGLGFVVLAARDIDLALLTATMGNANWWLVLGAVVSVFATNLAKTFRWGILFGPARRPPWRILLYGVLLGQFANIVLPARTGEVARAVLINRAGGSASFTLGTLVTEKMVETLAALTLLLGCAIVVPLPDWARLTGLTFGLTAVALIAVQWLLARNRLRVAAVAEHWARRLRLPVAARLAVRLQDGIDGLSAFARSGGLRSLVLWTLATWGTAVLTNDLVLRSLGIQVPVIASAWMLVVFQAGIALPASLGRIGAFLYLSQLGLGVFGVDPTTAAGYGLALFVIAYGPQLLMGLVALRLAGLTVAGLTRVGDRASEAPA